MLPMIKTLTGYLSTKSRLMSRPVQKAPPYQFNKIIIAIFLYKRVKSIRSEVTIVCNLARRLPDLRETIVEKYYVVLLHEKMRTESVRKRDNDMMTFTVSLVFIRYFPVVLRAFGKEKGQLSGPPMS